MRIIIARPGRVPEEASSAQPFRVWLDTFQGETEGFKITGDQPWLPSTRALWSLGRDLRRSRATKTEGGQRIRNCVGKYL